MLNPFDELQSQLNRIENLMVQILQREPVVQAPGPELPIGIDEVSQMLNLSPSRIYQNKAIPRHKKHNKLRFFKSEILAYIKNTTGAPVPGAETVVRRPQANRRAAAAGH